MASVEVLGFPFRTLPEKAENLVPNKVIKRKMLGFPGGTVVYILPANAGHTGSSPGLGRSHMPRSN